MFLETREAFIVGHGYCGARKKNESCLPGSRDAGKKRGFSPLMQKGKVGRLRKFIPVNQLFQIDLAKILRFHVKRNKAAGPFPDDRLPELPQLLQIT